MTVRRLTITGLCCLAFACAKAPSAGSGNLNDPCLSNADCKAPFICIAPKDQPAGASACALDAAAACDLNKQRCNGMDIETCTGDAGDGLHGNDWKVTKTCTTRCDWTAKTQTATCLAQVCTPGATQCFPTTDQSLPTMIQECNSKGSAWTDSAPCPTSCVVNSSGTAECADPICAPFTYRCNADDASKTQRCNARGTAWVDEACPAQGATATTCVAGSCLPVVCQVTRGDGGDIVSRDERCTGNVAEECNDTGTAFVAKQVCSNGCVYDSATKKATCPAQVCSPLSTQCKPGAPDQLQQCNSDGTAWGDVTRPAGERCVNGEYVAQVCSYVVQASSGADGGTDSTVTADSRCDGFVREQCNPDETGWDALEVCPFGCTSDATGVATCVPPTCATGEMSCGGTDGNALEKCDSSRVSWDFVQYCPAGCATDSSQTPTTAACQPTFCTPLSAECNTDPATGIQFVQVCQGDGAKYNRLEDCAQDCNGGFCTFTDAHCQPGDVRCDGAEAEACVLLSNGATEWRFSERCLSECLNGACAPGGSAGCLGGANATAICGAPNRQVITLHPLLADPTKEVVPCDNFSRVLLYTDPIVGADGTLVPDGTLVTFAHDYPAGAPDNLMHSADADPTTPGLQRPTLHGRAVLVLDAPASCAQPRTVTVTASIGGRATGTGTVHFAAPAITNPPTKSIYVAEDFSTLDDEDRTNTTAQWNPALGAAVAVAPYQFGSGNDGDYTAAAASGPHDLATEGYASSWNATRMGPDSVSVDNVLPTVAPGDEVLLMTLWSAEGKTIGTWELQHVAEVATGRIVFTQPIQRIYGNGGANLDFTNNRTIVQRVPNFQSVTVNDGASLTIAGPTWNGSALEGGTGVLAFRAKGTLRVLGSIDLSGRGFPWGTWPMAPPASATQRLVLGNAGLAFPPSPYAGGGIALLAARTLTFADDGGNFAADTATIRVDTGHTGPSIVGGTGGRLVAQGGTFALGADAATCGVTSGCPRFNSGTGGLTSLTYGKIDDDPLATPPPGVTPPVIAEGPLTIKHGGPFVAASTTVYNEKTAVGAGGTALYIFASTLEGVLGGDGSTTAVAPMPQSGLTGVLPSLSLQASADGGASFALSNAGRISYATPGGTAQPPFYGQKFKWKASLTNLDDRPVYLRGLAFKLSLN